MDTLKPYFTKRYFLFFLLLFVVWYPGSFLLYVAYNVTQNGVLFVALNVYYPLLMLLISYLYFRKSTNDWNDRFTVAFGWILLTFLFSALLVKPVYGMDWTAIINISQIQVNWSPFLSAIISGMFVRAQKNRAKR